MNWRNGITRARVFGRGVRVCNYVDVGISTKDHQRLLFLSENFESTVDYLYRMRFPDANS